MNKKAVALLCAIVTACLCISLASCSSKQSSSATSSGGVNSRAQSDANSSTSTDTSTSMASTMSSGISVSDSSSDTLEYVSTVNSVVDSLVAEYPDVPRPILEQVAAANMPAIKNTYEMAGIDYSATFQDSTLIYSSKFQYDITMDKVKQIADRSKIVDEEQIQKFKDQGVKSPVIREEFYDKNDKLLYSIETK